MQIIRFSFFFGGGGIFTKPSGVAILENASKGVFIMTTQYGRGAVKKRNMAQQLTVN